MSHITIHKTPTEYLYKVTWRYECVGYVQSYKPGQWFAMINKAGVKEAVEFKSFDKACFYFNKYNWRWLLGPRTDNVHHSVYEPYHEKVTKKRWALS